MTGTHSVSAPVASIPQTGSDRYPCCQARTSRPRVAVTLSTLSATALIASTRSGML